MSCCEGLTGGGVWTHGAGELGWKLKQGCIAVQSRATVRHATCVQCMLHLLFCARSCRPSITLPPPCPQPHVTPWQLWLDECRAAFTALTADKQLREAAELAAESARTVSQPDDLIDFTHLRARKVRGIGGGAVEAGDDRMQG